MSTSSFPLAWRQSEAYESVLALLAQMREQAKNLATFDRQSDELSVLCRAYMLPAVEPDPVPGVHLTIVEAKLVMFLASKMGKFMSKSAIFDALYFDRPDTDLPEPKIVDVMVCKVRRKFKDAHSSYLIETAWGMGYRMVAK